MLGNSCSLRIARGAGFGFVEFDDLKNALDAIRGLDGMRCTLHISILILYYSVCSFEISSREFSHVDSFMQWNTVWIVSTACSKMSYAIVLFLHVTIYGFCITS